MSLLNVSGISKKQGEDYVLKNINFVQQPLQKIAIAGATGSGKTTLLKLIAGFIQPDAGEVLLEGTRIKGPSEKLLPGHPRIAYLSQNFELRNNYKVEELLQMSNKLSASDAMAVYEVCRIAHLLNRWSDELSGGERQRIAFAKTLVTDPQLLLLDEPFSNLDSIHRSVLKSVIDDAAKKLNTTCILVSHDPVDLLSWAQEIIVLQTGKIIQRDTPEQVYYQPVNEYVAALFGKFIPVSSELIRLFPGLEKNNLRFVRSQSFRISCDENAGLQGEVLSVAFMGNYYEMQVNVSGQTLITTTDNFSRRGDVVYVSLKQNPIQRLD